MENIFLVLKEKNCPRLALMILKDRTNEIFIAFVKVIWKEIYGKKMIVYHTLFIIPVHAKREKTTNSCSISSSGDIERLSIWDFYCICKVQRYENKWKKCLYNTIYAAICKCFRVWKEMNTKYVFSCDVCDERKDVEEWKITPLSEYPGH